MLKNILCFKILLCLFFISCRQTTGKNPGDIVIQYHNKGHFNGAVLIAKNDSIILDTIAGYSNFSQKIPLTKQASFYIASLSKPVTATGIMLLQQKGLLSYDDKAVMYVKELPAYAGDITIRQLLTHTSGIKDYENALPGKKGLTNQDVIKWLYEQQQLQFTPGSRFQYSNSGYIILSLIIEHISGESYSSFLRNNVFIPLDMQHTIVCDETTTLIANRVIGFNKDKQPDDYLQLTTGDGGIYSTVEDLYKLDKALRNGSLLSKENTAVMYEPPTLPGGKKNEYGFGWFIKDSENKKIVDHTGGLNGFRALFWRDLANNVTIIALTNQGDAFLLNNFLNDLITSLEK